MIFLASYSVPCKTQECRESDVDYVILGWKASEEQSDGSFAPPKYIYHGAEVDCYCMNCHQNWTVPATRLTGK